MQCERSQELRLRNARPEEADELTALALLSKAAWAYDEAFMQRALPDMIVTPETIAACETIVAEEGRQVVGYARVRVEGARGTLHDLFVEPGAFGRGIGRLLCDTSLNLARTAGAATVELESDPNAEAFYLHLGARRIGEVPSMAGGGRVLPVPQFDLLR